MIANDIPPLWLRRGKTPPERPQQICFHLPALLRVRLKREALPAILAASGVQEGLTLVIADRHGRELSRETLAAVGPGTVALPRHAARVFVEGGGELSALKLGFYPLHKVALKLHAFANGNFGKETGQGRWTAAGAAARDLRGALTALIESSPARRALSAARYARYRARFVEDFTRIVPADAAPGLAYLSALPAEVSLDALAACAAALAHQSDRAFEWVLAVPSIRMEQEGAAIASALAPVEATGARVRIVACEGAEAGAAVLAQGLVEVEAGLVALLDVTGRPTRDATAMIRDAFARHGACDLLYTDEESLDAAGTPMGGVFKPAFNRHLLEGHDYLGSLCAFRTERAKAVGLRPQLGSAASYDFKLRYLAGIEGARIRQLPRVAYGAPATFASGFPDGASAQAAARALSEHLNVSVETDGRHLRPIFPLPDPAPLVSIVVPTRDRAGLLGMALRSLIAKTAYRAFEIVIVDNGSREEETFALFEEIARLWPATKIVRDEGDFNFPRICNLGVAASSGALVLLMNNDIEIIEPDWLTEMVALASRPGVGIVGAKLLYPNRTIQHAGVIVGLFRYAEHWFAGAPQDATGPDERLLVRHDLSAVTAACLLVRRDVWDEIGPLDAERFAEDCNDIDFCLRARRAGHEVVYTPYAVLVHHESASRGRRRKRAHRLRLKAQRARFEEIWEAGRRVDPHYNPNLARKSRHAALAEAPDGAREPRTDAI